MSRTARETGTKSDIGLAASVEVGRLEGLRALRASLAGSIESGENVRDVAALARQLRETMREIAELEKLTPRKSVVDDLGAKRKARRSGAEGVAPTVGGGRE